MMHKINYKLLVVFLLIVVQSSLFGATYYIATTGNNTTGNGTIGNPWQTPAKGFSELKDPGDTLYMRGGTYVVPESLSVGYQISGSIDNPIIISSYPGEIAILDGQYNVTGKHVIHLDHKDHIILRNFHITQTTYFGIAIVFADNVTLDNLTITHTRASGIWLIASDNSKIINNEVTQCTEHGQDESISVVNSRNIEVAYNHVHHNGNTGCAEDGYGCNDGVHNNGIGIDIKNGNSYINVHHNHIHDMLTNGIYVDSRGNSHHIDIHNNLSHDNGHNGITVASERYVSGDRVEFINIYNNIIYNCTHGINVGYSSMPPNLYHDFNIVNNTLFANIYAGIKLTTGDGSSNIVCANNTVRDSVNYDILNEGGDRYGLIVTHNNVSKTNGYVGSNYTTSNPLFVNESNKDFQLLSSSPMIHAGTSSYFVPSADYDGNTRLQGSAPTIGAFEIKSISDNVTNAGDDYHFVIKKDELIHSST